MDINTILYPEHLKLNALMAPFSGWNMPIHYGSIIEETKFTRQKASLFDICHMGELIIEEDPENSSLDKILTNPVVKMPVGRCRYGFLLNENGTVVEDLIVYRLADSKWMVVVNAGNVDRVDAFIRKNLSASAKFENISSRTVKLDLQGPASMDALAKIAGESIKALKFYTFDKFNLLGEKTIISRTGYTGELGYEIYIKADKGTELWNELLKNPDVRPAGLGARDILRLEAGLPLYGDELTEEVTPLEAGFEKYIDYTKEFFGKKGLVRHKEAGVKRKLTGILVEGRRTPRHGSKIVIGGKEAGIVTSGVFSPHRNQGIGFAYVDCEYLETGSKIGIDSGKGIIEAVISPVPFVENRTKV